MAAAKSLPTGVLPDMPVGSPAGLGLGLALAKQLVDLHGGSLAAHSQGSRQGMRFVVRLPLKAEPAEPGVRTSGVRRVLVVDDNRDAADSLGELLGVLGYDARTAHDGPAALA